MSDKSVSHCVFYEALPVQENELLLDCKHLHFEIIYGFDIVQSSKVRRCFPNQLFITGCCAVWT